ncbi:MAG: hypothetical protein KGR98_14415 [Verrucomicrobia bacterium]|nr:hypothetical protein [Verrucomicrobiota bacterium]MDE3099266.1 hypothetical protein [Verrucomicrobiota bacterium]
MNLETVNRASGAAVGFVGASILFAVLAVIVKVSVAVPAIDAARDAAIAKDLAEIHQTERTALASSAWIDRQRGIVRVPIGTAMGIVAGEGRDAARIRADLMAREENATKPVAAPKPKPNPFE